MHEVIADGPKNLYLIRIDSKPSLKPLLRMLGRSVRHRSRKQALQLRRPISRLQVNQLHQLFD